MRKLLKYELRALNRRLFPVYAGLLAVAVLNHFFGMGTMVEPDFFFLHRLQSLPEPLRILVELLQTLVIFLFFGLMVGMMVVWLMTTINRFRKGLLGEEGYLMFTLPVSTGRLMGAKLLGASVHLILAGLTATISIVLLMGSPMIEVIRERGLDMLREVFQIYPTWFLLLLEVLLLTLFSAFKTILQFYLAMALGHLSNRHRTLLSVVAYIGISAALGMLASLFFSGLTVMDMSGIFENIVRTLTDTPQLAAHITLLASLLVTVLQCALFWFPTRYILSRHLNLE